MIFRLIKILGLKNEATKEMVKETVSDYLAKLNADERNLLEMLCKEVLSRTESDRTA